ncbi:type IV secretion system protein [Qipengyuania gelatinilytica]|uniref:Type IV secretion system protein n=1 Tax=Qipengyuania gelatinilytica TaxID=2867231 RepID=A0ABX9A4B7_9SPHN|nr:type IV secretion system protein [Qipengyuania gelatinilytica]QZD96111.1 type IV secretion system protein [Qipengyuania gelatinilytica]
MTSAACQEVAGQVGNGVAAALRGVDCVAGEASAAAFGKLFAPGGALGTTLTIVLTIYVAIFGYLLLTGRTNIGVRALIPRMMTLGLVLTFATSWVAYQSVVWNLFVGTPDYLAGVLTGTQGSATDVFAQKIDVVFIAIQEASGNNQDFSAFSPHGMMWLGAMLFMLGTVGLLVTTKIALGILVALGPIFVVLALFNGTRGLFTGWLKGLVMCALAPLFAVLGGSIMLELSVPILSALTEQPGVVPAQAGMAFFMIGAVHVALMVMVFKVAAAMVSGWTVFGLVPSKEDGGTDTKSAPAPAPVVTQPLAQAQAATQASDQARRIDVSAISTGAAANDSSAGGSSRTTKVYATASGGAQVSPTTAGPSRTSGIGSRFKSAPPRSLDSSTEKKS